MRAKERQRTPRNGNDNTTSKHERYWNERYKNFSGDFNNDDSESNDYMMRWDVRKGYTITDDGDSGFDEESLASDGGHTVDVRDAGQGGSSQCLHRGNHDTSGYDTKSNADQVLLGSQTDRTVY
ncbi:hypothetical protein FN846DRAFT_891368 [Sphaerosporella brunnea]|uniref:Uncharacterized protein n=1 Tax=Sphaerosporella brunnea TaxID=1250544 RepID=A0A5J5ESQ9_9PEZI|nr:hypothetical protein FN846DRAFT_891368 [Sphaerosporella brunnea]